MIIIISNNFIRVEFLLPHFYNVNKKGKRKEIPDEKFDQVNENLTKNIGGYSIDSSPILGNWRDHKNRVIKDQSSVYWVLCNNTKHNKQFFQKFKKILQKSFRQDEIMMFYAEIHRF